MKVYQLYDGCHEEENSDYTARLTFASREAVERRVNARIEELREINSNLVVRPWEDVPADSLYRYDAFREMVIMESPDSEYPGDNPWHHFMVFEIDLIA